MCCYAFLFRFPTTRSTAACTVWRTLRIACGCAIPSTPRILFCLPPLSCRYWLFLCGATTTVTTATIPLTPFVGWCTRNVCCRSSHIQRHCSREWSTWRTRNLTCTVPWRALGVDLQMQPVLLLVAPNFHQDEAYRGGHSDHAL